MCIHGALVFDECLRFASVQLRICCVLNVNCVVCSFTAFASWLKTFCLSASPLDCANMSEAGDQTGDTRIAELRAELQKQTRAIAALTRKRKAAETRSRACASESAWPFVVRCALFVWAMRSDGDLAEAFLEEWPQNRPAETPWSQEQVREKMNTLTETEKEQLLRPTTKRGERAVTAATKYLRERSLFAWVQKQNTDKGLAPSYAALWRQFANEVDQPMSLQREPDAPPASDKHKRQRMQRWSRRWRVVQGRYKAGLRLPLETLPQRAHVDSDFELKTPPRERFWSEKVRILRPHFGARNPGPVSRATYNANN